MRFKYILCLSIVVFFVGCNGNNDPRVPDWGRDHLDWGDRIPYVTNNAVSSTNEVPASNSTGNTVSITETNISTSVENTEEK